MKLIPRSHFDDLRLNDNHEYDVDRCSGKRTVRIYADGKLIAKFLTKKSSGKTIKQYFAVKGYEQYLSATSGVEAAR
jgi:hypothetical protein